MKARHSKPGDPNPPGVGQIEAGQTAVIAAKAACEARLEKVKCDLEVERLEEGRKERERREQARLAREQAAQTRRAEEAQRRKDRRVRWQAFWENRRKRREELGGVTGTLTVLLALGIPTTLALLLYATNASAGEGEAPLDQWEVLAIGLLTAMAAFAVGALLGFLFGIPRSIAAPLPDNSKPDKEKKGNEEEAVVGQHFAANTNLEQISDWLTKILVGVGLVQIHQVSSAVENLANGLAPGLGPQGFSVAVVLLVAYPIIGFVSAYLYTRLRLQGAFELASVIKRVVKERADTETSALALVQRQLTPGTEKPSLDEIIKALKEATPGIRQQAFYLARRQRSEEWGESVDEEEKQELIRCTVPVFEALLASAPEIPPARLHAEIGHTYLRMNPPDPAAAKAAFDEAIKLRTPGMNSRTPQYELNRAYCTIKLDGNYEKHPPEESPTSVTENVYADLNAVVNLVKFKEVNKKKRRVILRWLEVNSTSKSDLSQRLAELLKRLKEMPED